MGKLRVHELAKKLNMTNQELITKLSTKGLVVKSHSSTIDEAQVMSLLQLDQETENRPRTVLRRRKIEEEVREEVAIAAAAPAAVKEPEAQTVSETPFVLPDEMPASPETTLASPEITAIPKAPEKPAAPPAAEPVAQRNVVRVIDPGAIKARLAAEGRTFGARPQRRPGASGGGYQGQAPSGGRPLPPRVRELKVGSDRGFAATPFTPDPNAQKPASPSHKPASKWKENKDGQKSHFKEKKEMRGGGYELWEDGGQGGRKRKGQKYQPHMVSSAPTAAHKRVVELSGAITVNDLAHQMSVKAGQVVAKLMSMGMMVTVNQSVDMDTATLVAGEFGYEVKNVAFVEEDILKEETTLEEKTEKRPPVVTVMGHVDHGKTSLLDMIRSANVAAKEAGGITQHIGAYSVQTSHGEITFLDTPGHSAFTAMRARGAQITDMVILVVAADDGIMPQTIEAINHAKAAKVPVIVAINKIDKPDAKPDRVMQQLSEYNLVPEAWGGDTLMFPVSALKNIGVKEMLEGIAIQAEVMELKGNPDRRAKGSIIEAKLDKGRGPVATVLVQAGTLKEGDFVVAGEFSGRIRAMHDSSGERLKAAGLSKAVQILGLDGVPMAGDAFHVVQDDKTAKTVAQHRSQKRREQELVSNARLTLENFLASSPTEETHQLRLVVKADVYGSVEALIEALKNLSTQEVKVEVVHSGVGTITENDINLALASRAIVIGFNIKPDAKAQALAAQSKIDIRSYSIIYEMLDEVRLAMAGLLTPVEEEQYLGKAEVRAVFPGGKQGQVAGSYVLDGKMVRAGKIRLKRASQVLFEGSISSLKRFKDDVKEVLAGYECGIGIEGFKDIKAGDIIECHEFKQVAARLGAALSDQKPKSS